MATSVGQTKIILIECIFIFCSWLLAGGDKIGVNYGMMGDLPSADQVVRLMKKNNIGKMRIFEANRNALKAFANSGIDVIVGVENFRLQELASSQYAANNWVRDSIVPFYPATTIKYIAVGNEVLANTNDGSYLLPAMRNIQAAIQKNNLQNNIKVSTAHNMNVIGIGFPPSKGDFRDDLKATMRSMLKFLSDHGSPFMANVYPYFSYIGNRDAISLDYALFKSTSTVVEDRDRNYNNLFDAMADTLFSAMQALGYPTLPLVVTETGWPSAGEDVATVDNAQSYNNNLIRHVLSNVGTPKKPGTNLETYIFALFNENGKPGAETERHFGLFNPDQSPSYPVTFLHS